MKRIPPGALLGGFALLLTAIPSLAHHTIAAEFDTRETVTLTGVFTKIDWINPHIYFYLDAKDDSGNVTKWPWNPIPLASFTARGSPKIYSSSGIPLPSCSTGPRMGRGT